MVGGGDHFYLKFWVNRPRPSEIADFKQIIALSTSTITLSEKSSINTNRKSTTRFPMSMIIVRCPKVPQRGLKTQKDRFFSKIALRLKKVCYEVSLCENCQRQCCRAFIGPTISTQKLLVGDVPFCLKFWVKLTVLERNRRFSIYFCRVSAVTSSKKSLIRPICPLYALFNEPKIIHRIRGVVPKPPNVAKNTKCPKFEQ